MLVNLSPKLGLYLDVGSSWNWMWVYLFPSPRASIYNSLLPSFSSSYLRTRPFSFFLAPFFSLNTHTHTRLLHLPNHVFLILLSLFSWLFSVHSFKSRVLDQAMSGITEDGSHICDATIRTLYDPAFKLFGRTIPVSCDCKESASGEDDPGHASGNTSSLQHADETPDSEDESSVPDELGSSSGSNDGCDEEKMVELGGANLEDLVVHALPVAEEGVHVDDARSTEDAVGKENETSDQNPKKPEKPIHCPRCNSLDTKFCYFNNYNVNQPRHFCKNCQRYWTAGGMLRNVPVGAGRRKNKHSGAYPRSGLSDFGMVRSDPSDNAQHLLSVSPLLSQAGPNRHVKTGLLNSDSRHGLPSNVHSLATFDSPPSSAVLSFGQESPVCISTDTASFAPCRSEVLLGYESEMSQAQVQQNVTANGSAPAMGVHMDQKVSDERHNKDQNACLLDHEFGAHHLKPVVRQSVVGERPTEVSKVEVPFTSIPKPEVGVISEIPKYVDAAFAWASSSPFSFMGGPWQYGANFGWGNTPPAASSANVAQGGCVNLPANLLHGASVNPLANLVQGAPNTCNSAGAKPELTALFGVQPPWSAAMGPWAGGFPWPLMSNPLWGPPGWGGAWAMPWAAAAAAAAVAAAATATPDLRITGLGKHPREQGEAEIEKVLVPKTLRIDDPCEAARSSIWSTLGLSLRSETLSGGGMFGEFKSKAESKEGDDMHARTRTSNPAGFDRSMSFQESVNGTGK